MYEVDVRFLSLDPSGVPVLQTLIDERNAAMAELQEIRQRLTGVLQQHDPSTVPSSTALGLCAQIEALIARTAHFGSGSA